MNINKVIIAGNLTKDPVFRETSHNNVCNFTIASNTKFKNGRQDTCFMEVEVWGNQADNCNKYLEKGRSVLIEGHIKQETWENGDGKRMNKHKIRASTVHFLGFRNKSNKEDGEEEVKEIDKSYLTDDLDDLDF